MLFAIVGIWLFSVAIRFHYCLAVPLIEPISNNLDEQDNVVLNTSILKQDYQGYVDKASDKLSPYNSPTSMIYIDDTNEPANYPSNLGDTNEKEIYNDITLKRDKRSPFFGLLRGRRYGYGYGYNSFGGGYGYGGYGGGYGCCGYGGYGFGRRRLFRAALVGGLIGGAIGRRGK